MNTLIVVVSWWRRRRCWRSRWRCGSCGSTSWEWRSGWAWWTARRQPGLRLIIPFVDVMHKVSLRIVTAPIQSQGIITRDNVSVDVSAVAYYRVVDAIKSVLAIENVRAAIDQIAQTTLRKVVGQHSLDQTLAETETINLDIRKILDAITAEWGVEVTLVELKDIELPDSMKRAMARQAEAEREKRAKIINAEGESMAAAALGEASDTMMAHPLALQLRNLQSLVEIGVDKNTTVVFPAPLMSTIEELVAFLTREDNAALVEPSGLSAGRTERWRRWSHDNAVPGQGGCDDQSCGCGKATGHARAGTGRAVAVPAGAAGPGRRAGPGRPGRGPDGQRRSRRPGPCEHRKAGHADRDAVLDALAAHGRDWLGHTVAFFACQQLGLFEALPLPCVLPGRAVLATRPHIRPLLAAIQRCPDYLVAIINRRHAWVLSVSGNRVETVARQPRTARAATASAAVRLETHRIQQRIIQLGRHHYRDAARSSNGPPTSAGMSAGDRRALRRHQACRRRCCRARRPSPGASPPTRPVTLARVRERARPVIEGRVAPANENWPGRSSAGWPWSGCMHPWPRRSGRGRRSGWWCIRARSPGSRAAAARAEHGSDGAPTGTAARAVPDLLEEMVERTSTRTGW